MNETNNGTENLLKTIVNKIADKKGENIVSLKFSPEQSSLCDYFVIATAKNNIQAQAIADALQKDLRKELKIKAFEIEGYENASWILMDYGDIIVHIFLPETREFYGLEKLWADTEIKNYNY